MEDMKEKGGIISDAGNRRVRTNIYEKEKMKEAGGITRPRTGNRPIPPLVNALAERSDPFDLSPEDLYTPPAGTPDAPVTVQKSDPFDLSPEDLYTPPAGTPDAPVTVQKSDPSGLSSEDVGTPPLRLSPIEMEHRERKSRQNQLVEALRRVTEEKGLQVFLDENQFTAMLSDYAPKLKEEVRLWSVAMAYGYGKRIILYHDNTEYLTRETYSCLKELFAAKTIQSVFLDPLNQLYETHCSLSDLDRNPVVESIRFCSVQTETTELVWYPEDSVPKAYISNIRAVIRFSERLNSRYLHAQASIGEMQYALKYIGDKTYKTVLKRGESFPSGYEYGKKQVQVTVENAFREQPYFYNTSFRLERGEYHEVRKIQSVEPSFVLDGGHIRYVIFRITLQPKAPSQLETNCWLRILDQQEHAICDRITQLTIPAGASVCYVPFGGEEFAEWKKGEYSYEISLYGSNLMRGTFAVS